MLIWLAMGIILITSFTYFSLYLIGINKKSPKRQHKPFSEIRQQEINEELDAGRLTIEEAKQLKQDLIVEATLVSTRAEQNPYGKMHINPFSLQLFAVFFVFSLFGAIALYQYLGFNNEVVFTEKVNNRTVTQEDMTDFLSYRAYKYNQVRDWYWLGKDYSNQGDFKAAKNAYEQALEITTENEQDYLTLLVEYAQSIFFANGQQASAELEFIIADILSIDPNQTSALGLQGIVEFERRDFKQAILVWQKAVLSGNDFAERTTLLDGIRRAREFGNISEQDVPSLISHRIKLKLFVNDPAKLPADSVFLVYARSSKQPMPVAIKRLQAVDLDNVIELTNLDNLMPGMTLKDTSRVDVIVKLANKRDQDLTKGKNVALLQDIAVNSERTWRLSIDL